MSYTLAYTGAEIDALLGKIDAIFVAEYGSTIYSEVTAAIAAGNKVIVANAGKVYVYAGQDDNGGYVFTQSGPNAAKPNATYVTLSTGNVWSTATVDLATLQQFYASLMEDTASGAIASFPDGAENVPVTELTADIEPIQDLHGYSNPWPAGGGKNKLEITEGMATVGGVTFTNNNGVISYSGTPEANNTYKSLALNVTSLAQSTSYILVANSTSSRVRLREFDSNGTVLYEHYSSGGAFTLNATTVKCDVYLIVTGTAGTSLSGTASPMICLASESDTSFAPYANICPITGYTRAEIKRTGKNIADPTVYKNNYVLSASGSEDPSNGYVITAASPVNGGGSYYVSFTRLSGTDILRVGCYDSDMNFLERVALSAGGAFNPSATTAFVRFSYATNQIADIQLEEGTEATPYEPFGTTYSIDWTDEAGTVYGGRFKVNEDESVDLTVERATITYDGSSDENWTITDQKRRARVTSPFPSNVVVPSSSAIAADAISNKYPVISADNTYLGVLGVAIEADRIDVADGSNDMVLADLKAELASTPLVICYKLATPQTYQLTPTEVTTLLGNNNIFSNTGDVEVRYRCNTALYIEKKLGE